MSNNAAAGTPVVFVHGLWLHRESWADWMELFRRKGYGTLAAAWPEIAEYCLEWLGGKGL